jgi:hypothetical protein
MSSEFDRSTVYKINNTLSSSIQTGFYTTSNAHKGTFFVTNGCNNIPITSGSYEIHDSIHCILSYNHISFATKCTCIISTSSQSVYQTSCILAKKSSINCLHSELPYSKVRAEALIPSPPYALRHDRPHYH